MVRLTVAGVLSGLVIASRAVAPLPSDGWLFLLIAPIAIVAVEYSFAGGFVAALMASVLTLGFKLLGDIAYSYTGVAVRVVTFLVAGAGVGYLVEERRRRDDALKDLQRRAAEHQEGLQLNDDVVQGLAVAKMALEMGEPDRAQTTLEETLRRAQEIASQRLNQAGPLTRTPGRHPTGSN